MANERDGQHIIAAVDCGLLTCLDGQEIKSAVVLDTKGMRSVSFVLQCVTGTPDPTDDIQIGAEDSPDNVTFTDVATYKILPSENYPDHSVITPETPYLQTCGVVNTERYVKFNLNCVNVAARQGSLIYKIMAIMFPEQLAFRAWDPDSLTGDGEP